LHLISGGRVRSPGRVHRLNLQSGKVDPRPLLEHDGSVLSAISVALRTGSLLYLGQVVGNGIGLALEA
jgi:hypothetical protein